MDKPNPAVCTCGRTLKNHNAMLQHQRDSPKHKTPAVLLPAPTAPLVPRAPPAQSLEQIQQILMNLEESLHTLTLEDDDRTDDFGFIPFEGSNPILPQTSGTNQRMSSIPVSFAKEGNNVAKKSTKKKRKNRRKGTGNGDGLNGVRARNEYGGQRYGFDMFEDQNWALCDKDCGWCGHCGDGII